MLSALRLVLLVNPRTAQVTRQAGGVHQQHLCPLPWLHVVPEPQDQECMSKGTASSGRMEPLTTELTKEHFSAQCHRSLALGKKLPAWSRHR